MSKIEELADELSKLTVLEMSELSKTLEEKWGVEAAAPAAVAVAAPAAGGGDAAAAEEATEFDVVLEEVPAPKKIAAIKVVRELTGLGLKEAKDFVDGLPKPVKTAVAKAEADEAAKKFAEGVEGAKVSVKPAS